MKVELKKVKHSPSLSRETNAYTAEVWVDGAKRGTVTNDGGGGPDLVEPWSLARELNEHAKTLPPVKVPWGDGLLGMNIDLLLGELLEKHLAGERLKKMLKTKTVLVNGGKCYIVKGRAAARPGDLLLNDLPFEEALAKFIEATSRKAA